MDAWSCVLDLIVEILHLATNMNWKSKYAFISLPNSQLMKVAHPTLQVDRGIQQMPDGTNNHWSTKDNEI